MVSKIGAAHTAFSETISSLSTPGLVPQIAGLQNGDFIIVWTNNISTTQSSVAGLFDQAGTQYSTISNELQDQWFSAAELSNGDLAFSEIYNGSDYIQTVNASAPYDGAGFVSTYYAGVPVYGLSMSNGADVAQAWTDSLTGSNLEVVLQIGTDTTPVVVAGPSTSISGDVPEVVQLTGGNYAVAWGTYSAFHVSILSSTGALLSDSAFALPDGSASLLDSTPQLGMAPSLDNQLAITESIGGQINFWDMDQTDVGLSGTQQVVSPASETDDVASAVTTLSNGDFVVGWYNAGSEALEGQLLSSTGAAIGSAFQIAANVPSIQPYISLTSLGDGKFAAAWSTDSGSTAQVEYQMFATSAAPSDFSGNGVSDVLLQNGGAVVDWLMQNGQYKSGNVLSTGASGWQVVGTGDFTGSGTSDVLLQNGGAVVDWLMQNGQYQSGNVLSTGASGWQVVGTGDFTGSGTSDVLLQDGGAVVDWIMQNGQYQSGNVLSTGASGWQVVGTGDFTGSGTSDVLLQNGGAVVDWLMQNGQYQSGNVLSTGASGWQVVGTGDFTGNGTDDILLQNGGTVVDWIMENGQYQSGNVLSTTAAGWTVVGTGDYNGDGTSDVLLQNGGTVVDWILKNGQYSSGNVLSTGAAGWTVAHSA